LQARLPSGLRLRLCPAPQAELLLRTYLEREGDEVPAQLKADLKFVLSKAPILLEEIIKVGRSAAKS
jgi:hypothetical protein